MVVLEHWCSDPTCGTYQILRSMPAGSLKSDEWWLNHVRTRDLQHGLARQGTANSLAWRCLSAVTSSSSHGWFSGTGFFDLCFPTPGAGHIRVGLELDGFES